MLPRTSKRNRGDASAPAEMVPLLVIDGIGQCLAPPVPRAGGDHPFNFGIVWLGRLSRAAALSVALRWRGWSRV